MIDSNQSVIHRCSLRGHQDTLYAKSGSQFYRESEIFGTVDFIFGDSAAVFQNCTILAGRPLHWPAKRTLSPLKAGIVSTVRGVSLSSSVRLLLLTSLLFTAISRLRPTLADHGETTPELCSCNPSCQTSSTLMDGCDGTHRGMMHPWTNCTTRSSTTVALALTSVAGCSGLASTE
jgi:hypothetical protein